MKRRVLSQALAMVLGGLTPLLAVSPDCDGELTGAKGEVKVLSPDITGVKVEVHVGASSAAQEPPGMDSAAGQKGATEYPGREIKCRPIEGGKFDCE